MIFNWRWAITFFFCLFCSYSNAAKMAIVIDDFGYRKNTEEQILQMPLEITIAILPNSPLRKEMEAKAKRQGREIIIHLPMAPFSKQPLEKDTITPNMSEAEINRIIHQAMANVPAAIGLNNHMGSAATSDLSTMNNVIKALNGSGYFFLDSMTTSRSQVAKAAEGSGIKVLKRNIFLDDEINETAIAQQFDNAIKYAKRHGSVIVIGHPHPATIKVLRQKLPQLPTDIQLVRLSHLLNDTSITRPSKPAPDETDSPSTPDIIDIPLTTPTEPQQASGNSFKEAIKPCPIEIPKDFSVPSQFSIMIESLEKNIADLIADDDKNNAYLYIS